MRRNTILIFSIFVVLAFTATVYAYPSLKIKAGAEITQQAGTTAEYAATVVNTGDVHIEEVYLTIDFLPSKWYNITEKVHLPVNDSLVLHYILQLPEDAVGTIKYDLIANAVMGIGVVAQERSRVTLKITALPETITNQQPTAQQTTTIESTSAQQTSQEDNILIRYKWVFVSIFLGVGIVLFLTAFVFWKD